MIKFNLYCMLGIILSSHIVTAEPKVQRPDEMEFDARVIQGQRAEGAVYLFQRSARPLPPLLHYKRDYLSAIVSPIFSRETKLGQQIANKKKEQVLNLGQQEQVLQDPPTQKEKNSAKLGVKNQKSSKVLKTPRRKKWQRSKKRGGR